MTITIEFAPEIESAIKRAAAEADQSPDAFVLDSVLQRLQPVRREMDSVRRLPKREAELLQSINQSLSQIEWQRYRVLLGKRQAEVLTPEEQAELIELSDRIEEANAERIAYVAELADIRRTTLPALMKELGLKAATYA